MEVEVTVKVKGSVEKEVSRYVMNLIKIEISPMLGTDYSPFGVCDKFFDIVDEVFGNAFIEDNRVQRSRPHRLPKGFPFRGRTFGFVNACQPWVGKKFENVSIFFLQGVRNGRDGREEIAAQPSLQTGEFSDAFVGQQRPSIKRSEAYSANTNNHLLCPASRTPSLLAACR